METILEFLKNNQIASGGLIIGLAAFLYQHGFRVLSLFTNYLKRTTFITYHFSSHEGYDLYTNLDNWLKTIIYNKKKNITDISVRANSQVIKTGRWILNIPSLGIAYVFIYTEDRKNADGVSDGVRIHRILITILKKNKDKFLNIVNKFREERDVNQVYQLMHCTSLGSFSKEHINLKTVILNKQFSNELFRDISEFLKSKQKYYALGNTYKRIYLLHGPPGNGKTSIIKLLSNYLQYNIVISSLSEAKSEFIRDVLECTRNKALFVFEDIDREDLESKPDATPLNKLLNIFDGITTPECIIIMTCNDISKLDPAFIRPGRIDRIFEIKNADKDQATRMFLKYYPNEKDKISNSMEEYTCHLLSMSKIQECLQVGKDIDEAINLFKEKIKNENEARNRISS